MGGGWRPTLTIVHKGWGVLDGAAWHIAAGLELPESMKLLILPPYPLVAPELMPIERLRAYIQKHDLRHRVFKDEADIDRSCMES